MNLKILNVKIKHKITITIVFSWDHRKDPSVGEFNIEVISPENQSHLLSTEGIRLSLIASCFR